MSGHSKWSTIKRKKAAIEAESEKLGPLLRMLEGLDDLDDAQDVWSNFDADEDALAAQ